MDKTGKKSGVSATFGKVAQGWFYVFSSNASPFESEKAYSPFQVYALLECNGDFKRAASEIAERFSMHFISANTATKINLKEQKPEVEYFQSRTFCKIIDDGSREPDRKKIFGSFLYEDTNTYWFSRTNYGKSLLVFQAGYLAATGQSLDQSSVFLNECEPMRVLVIDLEMDAKTLFDRHSKAFNTFTEGIDNLLYLHENNAVKPSFGFELLDKIEQAATKHRAKLIILDNISKILPDLLKAEEVAKVIESLKRIRLKTGCSFLVIGHTTKGDHRTAITPTSYYGSAALQNFFPEISFLDKTTTGQFFMCHAKTKRSECWETNVPILNRGETSRFGYGFSYEAIRPLSDVQLPLTITTRPQRKVNLSEFKKEIRIIEQTGISRATIAKLCNSSKSNITKILSEP